MGLYGPKVVWIFNGWFSSEFWRQKLDNVPCSDEEMEQAADGAILTAFYFKNPYPERGISGLTGKIYPFMPSGLFCPYKLDESIKEFMVYFL